jgi:UDP-N-acetylmuramoyl-L-alanyl-D-glutamate--2,6-diaminopimelate ligase
MAVESMRPANPTPHLLSELGEAVAAKRVGADVAVTGVALDSQSVLPGDLFVALTGANRHGAEFWPQAHSLGALAVLTDEAGALLMDDESTPLLVVPHVREVLAKVASRIYGTDASPLPSVFAVTGTNGKTSTSYLLDTLLQGLGWRTALSTTAERHVNRIRYPSTLTTPEAPDIHGMLGLALEQDVRGVVIEVSAQALVRHRFELVVADVAGFTNLSHDHLDDFGDIGTYFEAKAKLFEPAKARQAVVCIDTEWGQKLAKSSPLPLRTTGGVSSEPVGNTEHWVYRVAVADARETVFGLQGPDGVEVLLKTSLIGDHMVSNAALAVVMLVASGVELAEIVEAFGPDTNGIRVVVPGRIERVSGPVGPQVFVDSGVSVDSYQATLSTVRERTKGRVIMMFGTGGDRDPTKRFSMGQAAAQLADVIVVTDDDSRTEDPSVIRAALLEGVASVPGVETYEIAHPSDAIRFAVSLAKDGDAIVWSGPGAQTYREVGGEKIPYSARGEARQALADAGWPSNEDSVE